MTCLLWARADIRGECRARANETKSSLLTYPVARCVLQFGRGVEQLRPLHSGTPFIRGNRPLLVRACDRSSAKLNRAVVAGRRARALRRVPGSIECGCWHCRLLPSSLRYRARRRVCSTTLLRRGSPMPCPTCAAPLARRCPCLSPISGLSGH